MYEISLVPDIKSVMLKKQKMRNFVVVICFFVAAACGGVIALLAITTGIQAVTIAGNEKEIACRSVGANKCSAKYKTPIMQTENLSTLLTIQDQMSNLGTLNENKIKYSRVFSVLDVLLPDSTRDGNGNDVKISELVTDFGDDAVTLSFDANATAQNNNTGYRALEAFIKNSSKLYYDYGSYMRYDSESGSYVEIPSFCIEKEVLENGYVYGVYTKYAPGCESPMIDTTTTDENSVDDNTIDDEEAKQENEENKNSEESEDSENSSTKKEVQYIKIRRTYLNKEDLEKYKNGNDDSSDKSQDSDKKNKGYYFDSKCFVYGADGSFDEESTLEACPLLTSEVTVGDNSYGIGEDGVKVLRFTAAVPIDPSVFMAGSHHVAIYSPTRQNVTDSYVQIRDMFTKEAEDIVEE